jgi:hypothetical protein
MDTIQKIINKRAENKLCKELMENVCFTNRYGNNEGGIK